MVSALLLPLLLLVLVLPCAAEGRGQIGFSASARGDDIAFEYEFQGEEGGIHRLRFRVPIDAQERARGRFRAHDPRELERLAEQEYRRQLQETVAGLQRAYPGARVELKPDQSIAWRVGPPRRFADDQRRLFDAFMREELDAIRADFPGARITVAADGNYELGAPNRKVMGDLRARIVAAQERSNRAVLRRVETTRSEMESASEGIGNALRGEIAEIQQRMTDFKTAYYRDRLYRVGNGGYLLPDYGRIAQESLPDLQPVAAAFRSNTLGLSRRETLDRLLRFFQSIPYERLDDRSSDAGFLVPLVMLAENRGDCDSKAVAYATVMHLLFPEVSVSLVLVPQHAFLALAIPPRGGDRTLRSGWRRWVLAVPVGPALRPLGRIGPESERFLGQVDSVIPLFHP